MKNKELHIFALAAHGQGISGSDRIFIETSKLLSKKFKITIFLQKEGFKMCQNHGLDNVGIDFKVMDLDPLTGFGFWITYILLVYKAILLGFSLKIRNPREVLIYSASEFWMDSLPAVILKKRFGQIKWIAAWFQTAPNPLQGFNEKTRREKYRFKAFLYWIVQLPIKPLIQKNADLILVNNQLEVNRFKKLGKMQKIMVFLGALDLNKIQKFKQKYKNVKKKYQAVFQGRFHPQKGVVELIDIWRCVVDKEPQAKIAMIGDGPLMPNVRKRIIELSLEKNVDLFGYLFDGSAKYKIFAQSQIVLHPSFYDSGGMASAEAMAFGLPAVGFNLKAYQSYYPKGMVKVEIGDLDLFANKIVELLNNKKLYQDIVQEVNNMIKHNWSFEARVEQLLKEIT